jgi:hypothetical protein
MATLDLSCTAIRHVHRTCGAADPVASEAVRLVRGHWKPLLPPRVATSGCDQDVERESGARSVVAPVDAACESSDVPEANLLAEADRPELARSGRTSHLTDAGDLKVDEHARPSGFGHAWGSAARCGGQHDGERISGLESARGHLPVVRLTRSSVQL